MIKVEGNRWIRNSIGCYSGSLYIGPRPKYTNSVLEGFIRRSLISGYDCINSAYFCSIVILAISSFIPVCLFLVRAVAISSDRVPLGRVVLWSVSIVDEVDAAEVCVAVVVTCLVLR